MKLFLANTRENKNAVMFRNERDINSVDDLVSAAKMDHMSYRMDHSYRNKNNFLDTDCITNDLDNDHTDNPDGWKTLDDICDAFPDVHFFAVRSRNYMKEKSKTDPDGTVIHKEPREKYHVYFPLSTSIDSVEGFNNTMAGINSLFPYFDDGAKDCARMLFGVSNPHVVEIDGSKNIDDYLQEDSTKEQLKRAVVDSDDKPSNKTDDTSIKAGSRTTSLVSMIGTMRARRFSDEAIRAAIEQENSSRCKPPLTAKELEQEVFPTLKRWDKGTPDNKPNKVPALSFVNAAELAKSTLKEIYYPIENLVPEGETILAAPPKSGKSWMVLQMALAVAKGDRFLGFKTRKSDVVYFALEDGDKFEQERLLKLCAADKVPSNFHFVFQDVIPLDEGFIDQLNQTRNCFPELKLVIIDTLRFISCKQKKNESAYERDYRTGQMLKTWADKNGVAVVVVTHTTKLIRPEDALANVTGTNGVTGAADAVIVIAKDKRTATNAVLAVDGRRVRQSEHEITIDWNACQWKYVGLADPDERERRQREQEFEDIRNSSAYKAVMMLADKNVDGWKGKARKLIDDACEYGVFVIESAKEVGGMLTNNIPLFAQDGVRVEIIKNGTSGNIYRLSMWQKVGKK